MNRLWHHQVVNEIGVCVDRVKQAVDSRSHGIILMTETGERHDIA